MIVFIIFVVLLCLGFDELGVKGVAVSLLASTALFATCLAFGWHGSVFATIMCGVDIVLILVIFGGDITLR